ncbi:hypothetical protein ACFL4L_03125 [bacterium]
MFHKVIILLAILIPICTLSLLAEEGWAETEEFLYDVQSDNLLEVIMDVDAGEISVKPNDSDNQCLIRLTYSRDQCEARVDYKEKLNILKIILDRQGWASKWDDNEDEHTQAEIFLPKDVIMSLKTKVKAGEVVLDVGGLKIQEFHLSVWAGEVSVHFDEPNKIVMEYLDINTKVGELNTSQLGNARFKKAKINGGIGEIDVDLTGDLIDKAMAKIDLDIGEANIILPCDHGIRISIGGTFGFLSSKNIDSDFYKRGRYFYSENFKEADKSLSVRITPGLGELNVDCE